MERQTKRENWVPLREKGKNNSKVDYSQADQEVVSWNPNEIPYATELEIDLEAMARLHTLLQLTYPIKLRALHTPPDSVEPGNAPSKSGESVMSKSRRKEQSQTLSDLLQPITDSAPTLFINFKALADALEEQGIDPNSQKFRDKLGDSINTLVLRKKLKMVFRNYYRVQMGMGQFSKDVVSFERLFSASKALETFLMFTVALLTRDNIKEYFDNLIVYILLYHSIFQSFMIGMLVVARTIDLKFGPSWKSEKAWYDGYIDWLFQEATKKNFLPLFFCLSTMKYFNLPLLRVMLPSRRIFRGKK